jgi:peptidyl-prolyl cis-trans isomerase D
MQRNKKWLLPTIWISTIAFVGAGFVGWGSYNPSQSSSSIATVGDKEVSIKALQTEYSNLYSQYQQAFGKQFNKELAQKLNLENTAYNNVIQRYLLLNLSDELGFIVSDEEVVAELVKVNVFLKDGKFDNSTYKNVLKQNRTTPTDFEEQIRIDLKIRKVQSVYTSEINKNTLENLNKLFFAKDKISINIINNKDINVSANDSELKKYYEKNKNNYMSEKTYKVNIEKIAIIDTEKASKKTALRKYLKLKKGTESFKSSEIISHSIEILTPEQKDKLFSASIDDILKPIKINNEFVIYQLKEVIKPKPLAYEIVKDTIKNDLLKEKKELVIKEKVDMLLNKFTGNDIGYVSKETITNIDTLTNDEVATLVKKVSSSINRTDFIKLANKTIVFNITDTKLASYDKSKDKYIKETMSQIKNNEIMSSIIKNLESKYEVTSNYKVK